MNAKQIPPSLWVELQRFGETTKYWHRCSGVVSWQIVHARAGEEVEAMLGRDLKTQVARHVAEHSTEMRLDDVDLTGRRGVAECMAFTPEKFYELVYKVYLLGQSEGRRSTATMADLT